MTNQVHAYEPYKVMSGYAAERGKYIVSIMYICRCCGERCSERELFENLEDSESRYNEIYEHIQSLPVWENIYLDGEKLRTGWYKIDMRDQRSFI